MMWPPREDEDRARPSTARLHDSVAPLVKMISPGFARKQCAELVARIVNGRARFAAGGVDTGWIAEMATEIRQHRLPRYVA